MGPDNPYIATGEPTYIANFLSTTTHTKQQQHTHTIRRMDTPPQTGTAVPVVVVLGAAAEAASDMDFSNLDTDHAEILQSAVCSPSPPSVSSSSSSSSHFKRSSRADKRMAARLALLVVSPHPPPTAEDDEREGTCTATITTATTVQERSTQNVVRPSAVHNHHPTIPKAIPKASSSVVSSSSTADFASMSIPDALRNLEAKHATSIAAVHQHWQSKFQTMEAILHRQGRELAVTQERVQILLSSSSKGQTTSIPSKVTTPTSDAVFAKVIVDSPPPPPQPIDLCHWTEPWVRGSATFAKEHPNRPPPPAAVLSKQQCRDLIDRENVRMMRTWGSHFDDLVVYLQDNLDAQSVAIAEARASTFEQVDAEAQAREEGMRTSYGELLRQVGELVTNLDSIKEEQERSLKIIVENLIKVMKNVDSIAERQNKQESIQKATDIDIQKVLQVVEAKSNVCKSSFAKVDDNVSSLTLKLGQVSEKCDLVSASRVALQDIVDESIKLFHEKSNTTMELWTAQFDKLERRMQLLDYEELLSKLAKVMVAWRTKFTDLNQVVKRQGSDLGTLQGKFESKFTNLDGPESLCDYLEARRKKVTFVNYNVDQKKYKKLLWRARQERSALSGEDDPEMTTQNIEYYDLTFATSKE